MTSFDRNQLQELIKAFLSSGAQIANSDDFARRLEAIVAVYKENLEAK
ncbi:MAG: hypothetical protein WAW11_03920 [Patescibacteria group bacterium]